MTRAFVLSGGASLGSIQAGMALALEEANIYPDAIVGTSAGAINGSWMAAGRPAEDLAHIWRGLRRSELFPFRPLMGLRGFVGQRDHFVPNSGLRRLLRRHIDFATLEEAEIPFTAIATDAQSGEEVALSTGPAVEAVLASAALPGIFPAIEIDGRTLIDGGVVNNTPITNAIDAGATEVWVLSTGYSCGLTHPPKGAMAMALQSVALLIQQRLVLEAATREYPVPVHFIPPPCPIMVAPVDFSHGKALISQALAGTRQWLNDGCPNAMPLALHTHDEAEATALAGSV